MFPCRLLWRNIDLIVKRFPKHFSKLELCKISWLKLCNLLKRSNFWQSLLNAFIQFASHLANGTCGNSCSSDCVFLMTLECSDWLPLSAFYQLSQHLSWPHLLPTAAVFRYIAHFCGRRQNPRKGTFRNMLEQSGKSRNVPEHQRTWKNKNNFHEKIIIIIIKWFL